MKKNGICSCTVLLVVLFFLNGCARVEQVREIHLPPTPAFSHRQKWAVIRTSHLRMRAEPNADAALVTTLWNTSRIILEVVSQSGSKAEVENLESFWYQVSYGGLRGWVFGGYIEVVESREEAQRRIRQLR